MTELIGFHTRLSKDLKERLNSYSKENGISVQFITSKALKFYLDNGANDLVIKKSMYNEYCTVCSINNLKTVPYKQWIAERFNDWSLYENE